MATPLLRRGSSDREAIKRLQALLNSRGAGIQVDGSYGPQTAAAVRAFQAANRAEVDGVVGPQTWALLNSGAPLSSQAPDAGEGAVPLPRPDPRKTATTGAPRPDSTAQRFPSAADRAGAQPPPTFTDEESVTESPTGTAPAWRQTAFPWRNRQPSEQELFAWNQRQADSNIAKANPPPPSAEVPQYIRDMILAPRPTRQEALMSGTQEGFTPPSGGIAALTRPPAPGEAAAGFTPPSPQPYDVGANPMRQSPFAAESSQGGGTLEKLLAFRQWMQDQLTRDYRQQPSVGPVAPRTPSGPSPVDLAREEMARTQALMESYRAANP